MMFIIAILFIALAFIIGGVIEFRHRMRKRVNRKAAQMADIESFNEWLETSVLSNPDLQNRIRHYDASRKL